MIRFFALHNHDPTRPTLLKAAKSSLHIIGGAQARSILQRHVRA